jgi:hypothetical protein
MCLLTHIGHFFNGVGKDIQFHLEGAVMDFRDFARAANRTRGEASRDNVPDLHASMASFERMLRLLEENRVWPDESLHLEDDEDFDTWRDWPMSICGGRIVSAAAL